MEERMRASIETRFSSFEMMLGLLDFPRQQKTVMLYSLATASSTFSPVQCNTSGVCHLMGTRFHSGNVLRNFVSFPQLENVRFRKVNSSKNTRRIEVSIEVDDFDKDQDDAIPLQPG